MKKPGIYMRRRRLLLSTAAIGAMLACGRTVAEANYPNRALRIIVPFTPGSGSDSASRFYGEKLTPLLGQGVIVENKPGANGLITIQAVKSAPADGYTILLGNVSLMAVNPVMLKDIPYDPLKDFKPLYGLYRGAAIYAVSNDSKIHTFEDMIAAAKIKPLAMGTYSQGYQLAMEYLASLSQAKFMNIPYRGQAPLLTDLIGNQLDAAVLDFGGAVSMLKAGKMRPIAITSTERHPDMPDVPTVRERGFPAYEHYSWVGFFVRAETPEDITAKLSGSLQTILATPDAQQFVNRISGDMMAYPPAQMRQYVQSEIERFRKIATVAGLKPQ